MNSPRLRRVVLVLAILIAATSVFVATRGGDAAAAPALEARIDADSDPASAAPEPLDAGAQAGPASRAPVAPIPVPIAPVASPSAPKAPGRLRIRAIDARTGSALVNVRLRAASKGRIADREARTDGGELDLVLSPAQYAVLVMSAGYEPVELPSIDSSALADADVRTIAMRGGSAGIEGFVRGGVPPGHDLHVELIGAGRRPCEACPRTAWVGQSAAESEAAAWSRTTPCPACGFTRTFSRIAVRVDGSFAFDRLVSGLCALRLTDAGGRALGAPCPVELRESDSARVDLDAPDGRDLVVEFVDVDGAPLAPEWGRRLRASKERGAEPRGETGRQNFTEQLVLECAFRDEGELVAFAKLDVPVREGYTGRSGGMIACGGFGGGRGEIDDRLRRSGEPLVPVAVEPEFQPSQPACEFGADGRVRMRPLSQSALTLEVTCGRFRSTVAIPAGETEEHVRVQLIAQMFPAPITTDPGGVPFTPPLLPRTFLEHEARRYR